MKIGFLWMSNDDWIIQRENGTFTIKPDAPKRGTGKL